MQLDESQTAEAIKILRELGFSRARGLWTTTARTRLCSSCRARNPDKSGSTSPSSNTRRS